MKRRTLLAVIAVLFAGVAILSASYSDSYNSAEVKNDDGDFVYVRFRINIPATKAYIEDRIDIYEAKVASDPDDAQYVRILGNYEEKLERMSTGKPILGVWVFGDFNSWGTVISTYAGDDVPNTLIAGSSNPDTYYAKTYVPIAYESTGETHRYKFVINYGTYINDEGTQVDDYVYIEDPINSNRSDDGFGGFNSYFSY